MLLALAAMAVNGLILFSDRAPGLLRRLSRRIDKGTRVPGRLASELGIRQSDFEVHVLLWAVAALLVGLAAWSWISLLLGGLGLFACSLTMELLQPVLTSGRNAQTSDIVANSIGIILGLAVAVAFALTWRLAQALRE